jgi:hypothetical protein
MAMALTLFAATSGHGVYAQQAPALADEQQLAALFRGISAHSAKLLPLLDQVRAKEWIEKGAPDTYATQLASLKQQIGAINSEMETLAGNPDKMQDSLKALFRVQTLHRSLDSVMGGLRKYQNPALADLIQAVALEDQEDLGKLQEHILEIANQREQEYLVVDHEAQRCRSVISREPAPQRKSK